MFNLKARQRTHLIDSCMKQHNSPSIFVECERFWMIVQRCSSIWNDFERPYKDVHRVSIENTRQFNVLHWFSITIRAYHDIHRVWMMLNDCSKIFIDLEWCWTTVHWFPFFRMKKHFCKTNFFECWWTTRRYNAVHRCWKILNVSTTTVNDSHKGNSSMCFTFQITREHKSRFLQTNLGLLWKDITYVIWISGMGSTPGSQQNDACTYYVLVMLACVGSRRTQVAVTKIPGLAQGTGNGLCWCIEMGFWNKALTHMNNN